MTEIDPMPFDLILHSLLRNDDLPEPEENHAAKAMKWLNERRTLVYRVTSTREWPLLQCVIEYWVKNSAVPTTEILKSLVHQKEQCKPWLDRLEEFNEAVERDNLRFGTVLRAADLDHQLNMRVDGFEKAKLVRICERARGIALGSDKVIVPPRGKEEVFKGVRDAIRFINMRFAEGVCVDDAPIERGTLTETMPGFKAWYEAQEADQRSGTLIIPTGINAIQETFGGLRRGEFNGILGGAGQRKSSVARTIAYHAAAAGFGVLYLPLENSAQVEKLCLSVIHAVKLGVWSISRKAVRNGELGPEDKKLLFDEVIPDLLATMGDNFTIIAPPSRDWAAIKGLIESILADRRIDLVVLDYLTLLGSPNAKDDVEQKRSMVQECKRIAETANKGKGLCFLTPIQGNRAGLERAGSSGGVWDLNGIGWFSELEKSLDNCFYVYFNDAMNAQNQTVLGSCKTRWDQNIAPSMVTIEPNSGLVHGGGAQVAVEEIRVTEKTIDDMISDSEIEGSPY